MGNIKINYEAFKRNVTYTLLTVTLVSGITGSIIGYGFGKNSQPKENSMPTVDPMETIITVDEYLHNNTISDLAYPYYRGDTAEFFETTEDYTDYVLKTNGIEDAKNIKNGTDIKVPVVVSVDNEYFVEMQSIKQQIKDLEKNSLWVDYTVQSGDLITSIAAKASGSYEETVQITKQIMIKNGLSSDQIKPGQKLLIHNPELGVLKAELNEVEQQLKDNLQGLNRTIS